MFTSDAEIILGDDLKFLELKLGDKEFNERVIMALYKDWKHLRELLKDVLESPVHAISCVYGISDEPHVHLKPGLLYKITKALAEK